MPIGTFYQPTRTRRDLNQLILDLAALSAYVDSIEARVTDLEAITRDGVIGFTIDGGGSVITTGLKGFVPVPDTCRIKAWRVVADQVGSIAIDVWKDSFANFPPTDADSIAAASLPTLSNAQKAEDIILTGWSKDLVEGDWLAFNVDSASTVTRVTVALFVIYNEDEL